MATRGVGGPLTRIAIGLRELVPLLGERVADQPVDDRDERGPARRVGDELRVPARRGRLDRAPAGAGGLPEAAIDRVRERVVHELHRARRGTNAVERPLRDREVKGLDPLRGRGELLGAEPYECLCLGHPRETTRECR